MTAKSSLLDEHLAWPRTQWEHGGPWRLGHGLTVVGPGWWPLVRRAFAAVAEMPGAQVVHVKQKHGVFQVRLYHGDPSRQARLRALATELTEASRSRCEACGTTVPTLAPGRAVWRNHCADCRTLLESFDGDRAERRLWELRAGRAWPPLQGW